MKDRTGREIVVGCRVSIPPRVYGEPWVLAPVQDEGAPPVAEGSPRISGRVERIYAGLHGPVMDVRTATGVRTAPAKFARVQSGKTVGEKAAERAAEGIKR